MYCFFFFLFVSLSFFEIKYFHGNDGMSVSTMLNGFGHPRSRFSGVASATWENEGCHIRQYLLSFQGRISCNSNARGAHTNFNADCHLPFNWQCEAAPAHITHFCHLLCVWCHIWQPIPAPQINRPRVLDKCSHASTSSFSFLSPPPPPIFLFRICLCFILLFFCVKRLAVRHEFK